MKVKFNLNKNILLLISAVATFICLALDYTKSNLVVFSGTRTGYDMMGDVVDNLSLTHIMTIILVVVAGLMALLGLITQFVKTDKMVNLIAFILLALALVCSVVSLINILAYAGDVNTSITSLEVQIGLILNLVFGAMFAVLYIFMPSKKAKKRRR